MKHISRRDISLACAVLSAVLASNMSLAESSSTGGLDLDALYSTPSLIGTPPESIEWSPDGERIAYLWNKEGYTGTDVWLYSIATAENQRLTNHRDDAIGSQGTSGITELKWLNDQKLVYVYEGDLYTVDLSGNSKPILTPNAAMQLLSVSPDGERISFVMEGDIWLIENVKEKKAHLAVKDEGEKSFVERYEWSRDGNAIAFILADNRAVPEMDLHYFAQGEERLENVTRPFPGGATTARRIGILNVSDADITWLPRHNLRDSIWGFGWSADSGAVFVDSSDFLARHRNIAVYDVDSASRTVYFTSHNPNGKRHFPEWATAWGPGDRSLIVLSDHEGFYHLYRLDEPGAAPIPLTHGNWEVASFTVDEKNSQIYFTANRDHIADRQLYCVAAEPGGEIKRITTGPGTYEPFYSPDFRKVAFRFSDDKSPLDLYYLSLNSTDEISRVTRSPQDRFYEISWADVRYVDFPSHVDGTRLFGRLYVPDDFDPHKRYPLIVGSEYSNTVRNQWGGRSVHPTWGLDQYLVSHGYLVFSVNVRGSWGQGRSFRDSLKEFGDLDIKDIESGVRYLIAQGYVDPDRVGIWGSSYGGLMTAMSLFKNPGFYAAGIAGAPATNVWHAFPSQMRVMGKPNGHDYPARYERQSALYEAANLEDPLMIIHGTKDTTVLYSDTVTLVEKLIENNKMFELVTLPGADHHWDDNNIEQTLFAYKKMVNFFDQHVKNQLSP